MRLFFPGSWSLQGAPGIWKWDRDVGMYWYPPVLPGLRGTAWTRGVCSDGVCARMRGGGSFRWWMTSPLRETFPQPEHKEGRQKVKRMRKNRNLTQCVKEGRAVRGWERGCYGGGVVLPLQGSEILWVDRGSAFPPHTAWVCPQSAESPIAIFCPSICTSCCTSCQTAHQHLVAKWFSQPPARASGQHHIPGITCCEWCLEIQRLASVWECLPHRVPLSLWSLVSSHFIWVSYLKPVLSTLLAVTGVGEQTHTHSVSHAKTTTTHK